MRLTNMTFGQYYPGDSLLHDADPRTKIIASFCYVVVIFMVSGYASLCLLTAGAGAAILAAGIPASWIYRSIKPVLVLVLITFLFQLLFYGGERLASLGPLVIYREGAVRGGFLALRLVLLVLSGSVLTFTTPPARLAEALEKLLSPLARLKFPAYQFALMVTIALRFIPALLQEFDRIIKAQRARGIQTGKGGLVRRARNTIPLLLPLFVMSFRRADELAMAMESRCYRGGRGRTTRKSYSFGRRDAVLAIIVATLLAASLWLGRFG